MGRRGRSNDGPDGVYVVDKPRGPTSHDVVAQIRRVLRTRAVGHAGTLDPMATGVLVIAVGRATKLVPWLTAADKSYSATIQLGTGTDSLDADGDVVETKPVPPLDLATVKRVAAKRLGVQMQRPPAVSAIRVDGERLHEKVRRGEVVEAPLREVVVRSIDVTRVEGAEIDVTLTTGKGFYVRSFARDLAIDLETVGHLTALRRLASGAFVLDDACSMNDLAEHVPLDLAQAAARIMTCLELDADGVTHAKHGRPIPVAHVTSGDPQGEGPFGLVCASSTDSELLAVVRREEDLLKVVRGFPPRGQRTG